MKNRLMMRRKKGGTKSEKQITFPVNGRCNDIFYCGADWVQK